MFSFIASPLGQILMYIYNTVAFKNYGVAIIIFTILIKLILLPLTIKQVKSTAKLREFQPEIKEIQKKYKSDKHKMNEEMMKFYQKHNYNPASGCLPAIIQIPILFSLIYVIGKPLTYMLKYPQTEITQLVNSVPAQYAVKGFYNQLGAVRYYNLLNMEFLGLNLGAIPSYKISDLFGPSYMMYWGLLLIPILSAIAIYISSRLGLAATTKDADDSFSHIQRNMVYVGPIITLAMSFQFPAGLGVYWIVGYLFQIVQQIYINKHVIAEKGVLVK